MPRREMRGHTARQSRADGTSGTPSPTHGFCSAIRRDDVGIAPYEIAGIRAHRADRVVRPYRTEQTPCRNGTAKRPPSTRKHTVLPVSIRLKSTEKTPTCVSMRAFFQPISARIYFGKTASHRKSARFVQSRGALPQAYWMSVKAAQRRGCVKRAFCGVCFLVPGGLSRPVRIHCTTLFFRRSS